MSECTRWNNDGLDIPECNIVRHRYGPKQRPAGESVATYNPRCCRIRQLQLSIHRSINAARSASMPSALSPETRRSIRTPCALIKRPQRTT